jgi:hypothetical protein
MAKLQLSIDDELLMELKIHALKHKTTIKDIVTDLVQGYLNPTIPESLNPATKESRNPRILESQNPTIPEQKDSSTKESSNPSIRESWDNFLKERDSLDNKSDESRYYVLWKTHRTEPMEEDKDPMYKYFDHIEVSNGTVLWNIPHGGLKHFDKNGNLIPFRFTDKRGRVHEPTTHHIGELASKYGKPVTIEGVDF